MVENKKKKRTHVVLVGICRVIVWHHVDLFHHRNQLSPPFPIPRVYRGYGLGCTALQPLAC